MFPAERNSVARMIAWIERSVRCVNHCHGFRGNSGSSSGRLLPGRASPDANQDRFKNGFHPHASPRGGKRMRARSGAASKFGMALHYRCNLLVRGACGNRQVGRHRPSGQCAGTHEKGPPHLSRSCVARVGGRHGCHRSKTIDRMCRTRAAFEAGTPHRGFRHARHSETSLVPEVTCGFSGKDPRVNGHQKTSGHV